MTRKEIIEKYEKELNCSIHWGGFGNNILFIRINQNESDWSVNINAGLAELEFCAYKGHGDYGYRISKDFNRDLTDFCKDTLEAWIKGTW